MTTSIPNQTRLFGMDLSQWPMQWRAAGAMLLGNSALDLTDQLGYGYDNNADVDFWVARAGVALQKNVELDAYYNFAAKASGSTEDPDDTWGIELNYAF